MVFDRRKPKLWKAEEDLQLQELVELLGEKKWVQVAKGLEENLLITRTPKQCRDRWANSLNQANSNPFSDKEIEIILQAQEKFGNKWSKIAKLLPGRSENQVKNFMHATIRRNIRRFNKGKLETEKIKFSSLGILKNPEIREILTAKKDVKRSVLMQKFLSAEAKEIIKSTHNAGTQSSESFSETLKNTSQIDFSGFEDWNIQDFEDITTNLHYHDDYITYNENNEDDFECKLSFEDYQAF
ncbi:hypothetical protein SteCoe_24872 [Stentor coeruleus]|uniref:Myb-like DNA-binding domain containing protein n=1 Tax=Stentor coeruleus TaxID=5963 RepID=A0A1R2BGJ2_9CILI|nr:hypothetical protein SteCoe_24872 [Stentor coeruleus]